MYEEISRTLFNKTQMAFYRNIKKIKVGKIDNYAAAFDYSLKIGQALADAVRDNISSDLLPDGRLYYEIADIILRPLFQAEQELIMWVANIAQQTINKKAGLNLATQKPDLKPGRIEGIVQKAADAEVFDEVKPLLYEPIKTVAKSVVDETVKANVEFQNSLGLDARIIRTAFSGCCDWCASLAGEYDYKTAPEDVYRRHRGCCCLVEYVPIRKIGFRQNVHKQNEWRYVGE